MRQLTAIIATLTDMHVITSGVIHISCLPRNFVQGRGVQQIQVRSEDRENGDRGAVAP